MKNIFFGFLLFSMATMLSAQDFSPAVNHYAIMVSDLENTTTFYSEILGLKVIDNPTGNPGIRWFSLGNGHSLHVISGDISKVSINKSIHLALSFGDFDAFIAHLRKNNVPFSDWPGKADEVTVRPDGIKQIYVQDPDGYWLEINNEKLN